jgi:hypothetical protein
MCKGRRRRRRWLLRGSNGKGEDVAREIEASKRRIKSWNVKYGEMDVSHAQSWSAVRTG